MQRRATKKHTRLWVRGVLSAAAVLVIAVAIVQWLPKNDSSSSARNEGEPSAARAETVAAEDMLPVSSDKGAAAAHVGTPGEDFVEAEAMVVMNEDATAEDTAAFDALVEQYGAVARTISDTGFGNNGAIKALTATNEDAISQLIDALSSSNAIVHIQRSYLYHTMDDDSSAASVPEISDVSSQAAAPAAATPAASAGAAAGTSTQPDASLQAATPAYPLSSFDLNAITPTSVNDPRTVAGEQDGFLNEYFAPADYPFSGANVAKAWTLSRCAEDAVGGSSVTVAVLDTGCDVTHEDLKDNIDTTHMGMLEAVEVVENGTTHVDYAVKAGQCRDIYGHGTHVAGIVGASTNNNVGVAGASYNATVLPINIFYYASRTAEQPTSNTTGMVYAFRYLENLIRAGELSDLHVINMSLGAYGNQDNDYLLRQAMAKFRDTYRVITVCAGGNGNNQGPITEPNYPGDFPEAFSVTWLNAQGRVHWRADYNANKDISAPGTDIMSTMDKTQALYNASRQSYGKMSGSSMSTPVVAGVAALMWARYPSLTVAQVREAMQKTAHKVSDQPASSGSAGAVDAFAALEYADAHFASSTPETPTDPQPGEQPAQDPGEEPGKEPGDTPEPPVPTPQYVYVSNSDVVVNGGASLIFTNEALDPIRLKAPAGAANAPAYGAALGEDVDYTVTYAKAGGANNNASLTAEGKPLNAGNYVATLTFRDSSQFRAGSASAPATTLTYSFTVAPYNLSRATVTPVTDVTYDGTDRGNQVRTGTKVTATPKTGGSAVSLTLDTDYTINLPASVVNAGSYPLTIQGRGNYTGQPSTLSYFTIAKKEARFSIDFAGLASGTVPTNLAYGDAVPAYAINIAGITDGDKAKMSTTNTNAASNPIRYTVQAPNNNNVGNHTVSVALAAVPTNYNVINMSNATARANDTLASVTYSIAAAALSSATATATIDEVAYREGLESFIAPVVTLKRNGTVLKKDVDYTVTFANVPKADPGKDKRVTVTATFTGKGNYNAFVSADERLTTTFEVIGQAEEPKPAADTHTYTGKPIRPGVNLSDANGTPLKEGKDYIIAYSNNVRPGTARMTIVGIGLYCGTIERTFKIVRPARNATPSTVQSVASEAASARSTIDTVAVATAAQMTFRPETLYKIG